MAYESFYWKKLLKRDLDYLSRKMSLTHKDIEDKIDEHFSYVEIKLMTTAYIIRKLADSGKLPDNTLTMPIRITRYKRNKKELPRPYVDIEGEYDLTNKSVASITLRKLCNQIIHSYILQAVGNRSRAFSAFWVTSDSDKDNYLYEVSFKQYITASLKVANAHVGKITSYFDHKEGKWIRQRSKK